MRELNEDERRAVKLKEQTVQQVPDKQKLVARQRVKPGLETWEYNTETTELMLAMFERGELEWHPGQATDYTSHRKVVLQPNCKYFQALNQRNAVKKMWQQGHLKFIVLDADGQRVAIDLSGETHGE